MIRDRLRRAVRRRTNDCERNRSCRWFARRLSCSTRGSCASKTAISSLVGSLKAETAMFGALGGLANMAGLVKQAREMGSKMEALQEDLRRRRVVGIGASNLVEVEMNGVQEVTACRIDPRLLAQNDGRQIELLVRDAVNDAIV